MTKRRDWEFWLLMAGIVVTYTLGVVALTLNLK